jgi:fructan beta-fructosidase
MTVAQPNEHQVSVYRSSDLRHWTHASDFGPMGATGGQWECPDLFPVRVQGGSDSTWVMIVNINPGGVAGGSGTQYFLGAFDGFRFTPNPTISGTRWLDYGPDFYAAVTWNDAPDGRRVLIPWISNWKYGQDVPTSPWRSAMGFPRELGAVTTSDGLRVQQHPVRELRSLHAGAAIDVSGDVATVARSLARRGELAPLLDVTASFSGVTAASPFWIDWMTGPTEYTRVRVDPVAGTFIVDRSHAGRSDFSASFPMAYVAPLRIDRGRVDVRLLVDASSIEVFANDGAVSMTSLVFPTGAGHRLRVGAVGAGPSVRLHIQPLRSALQP